MIIAVTIPCSPETLRKAAPAWPRLSLRRTQAVDAVIPEQGTGERIQTEVVEPVFRVPNHVPTPSSQSRCQLSSDLRTMQSAGF